MPQGVNKEKMRKNMSVRIPDNAKCSSSLKSVPFFRAKVSRGMLAIRAGELAKPRPSILHGAAVLCQGWQALDIAHVRDRATGILCNMEEQGELVPMRECRVCAYVQQQYGVEAC